MIRRMVNGKSPRKSPRTKRKNNKKSETSQILNAIDKLTQLELQLKAKLEKIKKQKRMLWLSLSKITSPKKL
jgi:Sec7-like guanine-nucleotide exchange factor|tara:strand:- start:21 stop:236 length:216 start_codon:yes stop_codon:yes gene_type:complete